MKEITALPTDHGLVCLKVFPFDAEYTMTPAEARTLASDLVAAAAYGKPTIVHIDPPEPTVRYIGHPGLEGPMRR